MTTIGIATIRRLSPDPKSHESPIRLTMTPAASKSQLEKAERKSSAQSALQKVSGAEVYRIYRYIEHSR